MKKLFLPFIFASVLCAQTPPEPPPDTVIATIDGKSLTYGELHSYLATLSQPQAQAAMQSLENTVKQYAMLGRLSKMGEDQKLDQKQPYIDILRAGRMQVMAQAAISEQYSRALVLPNEQEQYYKDHKAQLYSKLRAKAIYIPFASKYSVTSANGKKFHTEDEAREIAINIISQIHAGADFVAMVKQYSEDEASKKNNGDWGDINAGDNLPDDFKKTVLALKIGQITEPMRRSGGYYIFKADSIVERPYSEVRDEIYNLLKEAKMRQWMDSVQQSILIKIDPAAIPPAKPADPPAGQ